MIPTVSGFRLATTLWERLRGMKRLGRFEGVLVLVRCNDVHTFGMKAALDIAFVSAEGKVLSSFCDVPKRRRLRCPDASYTLERYSIDAPWFEKGETVALCPMNDDVQS